MAFDIIIEEGGWDAAALQAAAERAWGGVSQQLHWRDGDHEAALLACDDARIAELNSSFRGKPAPTNVLSWPAEQHDAPTPSPAPGELGDIALALETITREAADQGKRFADHLCHLIVHALLHLIGYDHETEQEAAVMEALEVEILAKLGIEDPY